MKIFLAGGYTGNLRPLFDNIMKMHLAGTYSRIHIYEESMKLFLAGVQPYHKDIQLSIESKFIEKNKPHILESFFYIRSIPEWYQERKHLFKSYILDSGAFSFFDGETQMDWVKYTHEYCDFIIRNKIDLFFEMDIEKITSMETTETLRKIIQDRTGINPIPVWRPMRGIDYWHRMIEEFDYIAISASGRYDSAWTRKKGSEIVLKKMVQNAHQKGIKVHGLGYTKQEYFKLIKFDSVDSTAWLYGNRGGFIYEFKEGKMIKYQPEGMRLKGRAGAVHNFTEWVKYSNYLEKNV